MIKGYYFITDSKLSLAGNISDVKNALAAGVKVIQYRDKHKNTKELYKEALALRTICKKATFLMNDRLDIAIAVNADGVHLGNEDFPYCIARKLLGPKKIIGLTVHSLLEAIEAEKSGADYLGVSPIFSTKTKLDAGNPKGIQLLKKIRKNISIPVVAIGGIGIDNAPDVIRAGADGLCAISAVIAKKDVQEEIKKFQVIFYN